MVIVSLEQEGGGVLCLKRTHTHMYDMHQNWCPMHYIMPYVLYKMTRFVISFEGIVIEDI